MSDLLKVLGVLSAIFVVTVVTVLALMLRALHRANRIVADRRSPAPIGWLWSWRQGARLHRRLRRCVQIAEAALASLRPPGRPHQQYDPATPLHDVAAELTARAVLVDDWLVAASRLQPQWSRPQLAQLSVEVRDLESSAQRLQQLSSQWRVSLDRAMQATAVPAPDLRERLDAVEAALHELPTGA